MPGGVCPAELVLWLAGRRPGPLHVCQLHAPRVVAADPRPGSGEPSCPFVQDEWKTRCLAVPENEDWARRCSR